MPQVAADIQRLKKIAQELRVDVIRILTEAGSGHPGGEGVVRRIAVRDFGESGDPVAPYKKFGLSIDNIVAEAKKLVKK